MPNSLDKNKAIRIETEQRKGAGPRYTYIFKCKVLGCDKEIRARGDALTTHSGKCSTHSHRKRPYESIYNRLFKDWRGAEVDLTYDEFVNLIGDNICHYCGGDLPRVPYATVAGKFGTSSYCLDRKNPQLGYSKDNCVSCCWMCNRLKSDVFTYKEFMLLSPTLRLIREAREKRGRAALEGGR